MNDEKFRIALHTAADDCLSGVANMASQRRAVFERIEGKHRPAVRKAALAPVMAALLTLALAGATAAGLGLFAQLRASKVDEVSYERLAHLEEAAVSVGQTADIDGRGTLTVDQAYCDGRRLYYSYTLTKNDPTAKLFVGDGAELTDGYYMNPVDSGDARVSDTVYSAYYEVMLPEGYAAGDTLTFVLTVMDGESLRYSVPVTVPVTGRAARMTGEGTADGYAVKAELFISDVDVSGCVRIYAPEDYWPESYKLVADGVECRDTELWWEYDGEACVVHLRFDLPKTMDSLVLTLVDPAYAHEAIVLKGA